MGVARNLEKRLEGLMEGFFTKLFRSGLQPVEVGRRIQREMDEGRTVSVNRVYAPNEFRILMGPEDFERFSTMEAGLVREFRELAIEQAKQHRWKLMGMPRFSFEQLDDLGRGEFKVEASLAADPEVSAPPMSTREPDEANPSATRAIPLDAAQRLGIEPSEAKLVFLDSSGRTREEVSLARGPVSIGRLASNDVVLSDPNVSRRHAELRRDGSRWVLVDLGSTNGTMVNGKLVRERELGDGDRVSLGSSELVFELERG